MCCVCNITYTFICLYAPSQWETTLQCNVVSHWLGAYTKWSLYHTFPHYWDTYLHRIFDISPPRCECHTIVPQTLVISSAYHQHSTAVFIWCAMFSRYFLLEVKVVWLQLISIWVQWATILGVETFNVIVDPVYITNLCKMISSLPVIQTLRHDHFQI